MNPLQIAITSAAIAVIVPLVMHAITPKPGSAERGRLRYTRGPRALGVILLLPAVALFAVGIAHRQSMKPADWLPFALCVLLYSALVVPLAIEVFRVEHTYDDEGVHFRSPWSTHRTLLWKDVSRIRWRSSVKWLDIDDNHGKRIHISPLLGGLEHWAATALANISHKVVEPDPTSRGVLLMMKHGQAGRLVLEAGPAESTVADLERYESASTLPRVFTGPGEGKT